MKNVLSKCFIKEEEIYPEALGGKTPIKIRQLTAGEGIEYQAILRDKEKVTQDAVNYAVECAMVEPKFFTEKELKNLNITGKRLIDEIHYRIPTIGMTEQEKKAHEKKILDFLETKKDEEVIPDTKEEIEGK